MMQDEKPFGLYDDNGNQVNPDLIVKPIQDIKDKYGFAYRDMLGESAK